MEVNDGTKLDPVMMVEVTRPGSPSENTANDILNPITDLSSMEASSIVVDSHILDTLGIYAERSDGSPVQITFLADIDGDQQMFPLLSDASAYEPTVLIEEPYCDLSAKDSSNVDKEPGVVTQFVSSQPLQQLTALCSADGKTICYIQANPSSNSTQVVPKDLSSNRALLYSLLNKEFSPNSDQQLCLMTNNTDEDVVPLAISEIDTENVIDLLYAKKAKTKRVVSSVVQIGSDLPIEEKLQVLESMLPPKSKKSVKRVVKEEEEGVYNCDMCSASFVKASQLYGHSHTHTSERILSCRYCKDGKLFSSHAKLSLHERRYHDNVRGHACTECCARFERASQLDYHRRRIHMEEKTHTCSICSKGFFKLSDLRSHINIHLGLNSKVCHMCGRKFNHISNLNRHMRTHSGVKPYPCPKCGRRFIQPSGLAHHLLSHETQKLVACMVCGKAFKQSYLMRKHVKTQHKDVLEATDDTREMLQLKSGAQSRNFYCTVCGERFPFAILLKKHETLHETQNDFRCSGCSQDLDTLEQLKVHSCQVSMPGKEADEPDNVVAEYDSQLKSLLDYEDETTADGSTGVGDFIIYVLQDGHEHPTQVHIRTATEMNTPPIDYIQPPDGTEEDHVTNAVTFEEELVPVETEEIQIYRSSPVESPEVQVHRSSPVESPEVQVHRSSPVQSPEVQVHRSSHVESPEVQVHRSSPDQSPEVQVHRSSPVQSPEVQVHRSSPAQSQLDAKNTSPSMQIPRTAKTITPGRNRTAKIPKRTKKVHMIITKDVRLPKQDVGENNVVQLDTNDGHPFPVTLLRHIVTDSETDGLSTEHVKNRSIDLQFKSISQGNNNRLILSNVNVSKMHLHKFNNRDVGKSPERCRIDSAPRSLVGDRQDVNESSFKLSDETLGLMKLNPSKIEEAPTSPLLNHAGSDNENSSDQYLTGAEFKVEDGLPRDDDDDLKYEDSIDPLSLFKRTSVEKTVDITITVLPEETKATTPKKQSKIFECPECHKKFTKNGNFKQHIAMHFVDQQRYCCPTCGQCFAWKSTLNKHVLRHTGIQHKFPCGICHKEYSLQSQVQDHIKRDHLKERTHVCSVCEKTFFKKHDLKIHLRTHTQEKPYICKKCGKRFYHISHIIRHELTHTGAKPFPCSGCGKSFTQASSLKVHQQSANRCSARSLGVVRPAPIVEEEEEDDEDLALNDFRMPDEDHIMSSFSYHHSNMSRDEF